MVGRVGIGKVVRVFVLDDHRSVREGIVGLLGTLPDMEVVGSAGTVGEALAGIPAARPDVAVLDIQLPDGNGVQVCRAMRDEVPGMASVMLTSFAEDEALVHSVVAGAAGYVIKDARGGELVKAIRTVAGGARLLDAGVADKVIARLRPSSERASRVLDLIGQGMTNRQIGAELGLDDREVADRVAELLRLVGA